MGFSLNGRGHRLVKECAAQRGAGRPWTQARAVTRMCRGEIRAMRKIKAAVKKGSRSVLGVAIGPLLLIGSWVPPGAASDRPDTKLRKGVDPRNPPSGYYEDSSPPLRARFSEG